MQTTYPTSAIVLAGGRSRRMGQDKRRMRLWGAGGPTLLEYTVALVAQLCGELVVVLNDPQDWPELPGRLVPDVYPDGGALGGLYAGLLAAQHRYALVVACDMPLLSAELLGAMLARPRDYEVLVPRSPRPDATRNPLHVEPLHAIYSKACLPAMQATLESGQRQVVAFFPAVSIAYVELDEQRRYDPHGRALLNINTPAQIDSAGIDLA